MSCRCGGRKKQTAIRVASTVKNFNDPWIRFVENESPELLSYPMERTEYGAKFDTQARGEYAGIITSAPINFINEQNEWEAIDAKLVPTNTSSFGTRHGFFETGPNGNRVDDFVWQERSVGAIKNGVFRPIWKPSDKVVDGNYVKQQIGPILHEMYVEPWVVNDWYWINEMPNIDGDLAVEFDRNYNKTTNVPWMRGAEGGYFELETKWMDGRWYKVIKLEELAQLIFPVFVDPEIAGGSECWNQRGTTISFNNCATSTTTSGANNLTAQRIGQYHQLAGLPPVSRWTCARCAGKWNGQPYSGTIISADVKMSCNSDTDSWNVDQEIRFARTDWHEYTCPVLSGEFGLVKDRCRASTLGADLGLISYYDTTVGCTTPNGTYGDWFPLNAGDIAHLNSTYGLGDARLLNYCLEPEDLHNLNDTIPNPGDSASLWFWLPQKGVNGGQTLRFNAGVAGFVWLVGG